MARTSAPRRGHAPQPVVGLPARRLAIDLLVRTLSPREEDAPGSLSEAAHAGLAPRDRALARLIAATTLRRLPQIEAALGHFLSTPIDGRAGTLPLILKSAAAQILFLDMPAHAVVNIATALAAADRRGRHLKGVVNAVLRRLAAEGPAIVAAQDGEAMVIPAWLSDRWRRFYGDEASRAIAALHLAEPPLDLAVPRDAQDWAKTLGGTMPAPGTVRLVRPGPVPELAGFMDGAWWVQDAAAALAPRLLGDVAGLAIIDLCAAPGGKTAALSASGARVTALDRDPARMARLDENLDRLGLAATRIVADVATWRPGAPADIVLLDAPCSATGIMRRHPDIMRRRRLEQIAALAAIQGQLLEAASDMVRPGGRLLYCTCSLEPEEGEEQIARLLVARRDLARAPISPESAVPFAESLNSAGELRILPTALAPAGGNDGFFIAILNKVGTNQPMEC